MFASSDNAPLFASLARDLGKLTARSQQEEKEIDGIAEDLEDVEWTWKGIKVVLADAEKRQIREKLVREWLLQLRGLAEKIENLRDVYEYEVVAKQVEPSGAPSSSSSSGDASTSKRRKLEEPVVEVHPSIITSLSPLLDASFREQMARDIGKIKKAFKSIAERKETLHLDEADGRTYSSENDDFVRSKPTGILVADRVFLGRKEQLKQLCALLKADPSGGSLNYEVIAVVGMGGMGKTTLAQHVCEDPQITGHFDKIGWVHVSEDFDVTRLIKAVIENLGGNSKLNELSPLQKEAQKLMKDKKMLLVMDDVWKTECRDWEDFLAPFNDGPIKGSKILVTTRLDEVAPETNAVKIDLEGLSLEHGWSLLKQHAFRTQSGDASNMRELEEIGKKIVVKCGGLPLSLKLLGCLLSDGKDDAEVWTSVLDSNLLELGNVPDLSKGGDAGQKILGSLYLSYLHLSPKLQSCFKCCSRYRNGYLHLEDLKQSWLAYDIVNDKKEANRCLDALVSRSFLEVDRNKDRGDRVRMHDHIYDLAQYAQQEKQVTLHYYGEDLKEELNEYDFPGVRHLYISFFDCPPRFPFNISLALANVCTLELHFSAPMGLQLSSWQYLRELMILETQFHQVVSRGYVGCQDRLKYLRIARIDGKSTVPLWVLQSYNLRCLEMRFPELECFPDSIGNLRNLRCLSLNCRQLRNVPETISSLTKLQGLDLSGTSISCLPESISRLTNLQELRLKNTDISCLSESVCKLANLQELNLKDCFMLKELPEGIVNLTNLQILDLCGTGVSFMPKGIGALTKLTCLSRYFIRSEKARLAELKNMRHLEDVTIVNLRELVNAEDASHAEMANKSHLRKLMLVWWVKWYHESLKDVSWCISGRVKRQVQRRNDDEIARCDEQTLQSLRPHQNLEAVFICGYRGYELPSWMGSGSFSKLYKLMLVDMNCCTSLIPIDGLPSLEKLVLVGMASLQELVPNHLQSATEPQHPFPKLRKLYIYHCDSIELLPLCKFPSLEYVKVHGCSNLKHMEPPYHVPCLLKYIDIHRCPKFEFSPDPQSPWKLDTRRAGSCCSQDDEYTTDEDENMTDEDDSSGAADNVDDCCSEDDKNMTDADEEMTDEDDHSGAAD